MARIRQIKPEFFLDEELAGSCCRDARYLYIGLWGIADREGRLEDRPARIKAQVFPYDDDITVPVINKFIDELDRGDFVLRYEAEGKRLLWVRSLKRHQHFHRDEQGSKLPEPPADIEMHRTCTMQAPYKHHTCTPTSTSGYLVSGIGNRGSGIGDLVSGNGDRISGDAAQRGAVSGAAKKRRTSQRTGCPDSFDITEGLKEWASKAVPGLNVEAETENFLDHHRAKGSSFCNWDAAWKLWMRRERKYHPQNNPTKTLPTGQQRKQQPETMRDFEKRIQEQADRMKDILK
ncbi:MAG: hypothetical protein JW730_18410 [Anaerolineales bacterium]|nr:hypothetical protein [Anaerolineales bacterium]